MSILIIDSTPGPVSRLKTLFEEYGLVQVNLIKTAAGARTYVEALTKETSSPSITLVVIDDKLEDGEGLELCRGIRKLEQIENAWIIMLVSSAENRTAIENAKHSGADDFAVKPYESKEFTRHLAKYAGSKTVLLVEDDPVMRQMLTVVLQKRKMEIISADDGVKAYNLINSIAPPRLVLLDIGLPGMNGLKLVEHIRTKSTWRKTPIVMITGSKEAIDVKTALSSGANDYVVKPIQASDIQGRLDKYLVNSK